MRSGGLGVALCELVGRGCEFDREVFFPVDR